MPLPLLDAYAKKAHCSIGNVEREWDAAKKKADGIVGIRNPSDRNRKYWALVNGILKRSLGLSEALTFKESMLHEAKEMSLDELSKYKVDKRFSGIVQLHFDGRLKGIKDFLGGEKPAATVTGNGYKVHIMQGEGRYIIEKDGVKLPAPGGKWMGFWDPDLKKYASEVQYDRASPEQQMQWDAQVQLDKYVDDQFYENYAGFWMIKQHDDWWWSGGADLARSNQKAVEEYWKKQIKQN
jgi:hypothetical protein